MEKQAKKQIKLSRVIDAIFTSLAAFLLLIVIVNVTVPDGLISLFGVGFFRVTSPSMDPVLKVNDYVIARKAKVADLNEGDIIIFHTHAQLTGVPITENIIAIHYFGYVDENDHILTYSEQHATLADDNPDKYDRWGTESTPYYVSEDDLIGKHTQTLHTAAALDTVGQLFQNPWTYVVLGGAVIGGGGILFFRHRKHAAKKPPTSNAG